MTWQTQDISEIVEQIPIGVAVTLPRGTVEYANPCLCRLLDVTTAQMQGADLAQFRLPANTNLNLEIMRLLLEDKLWQGETKFRTGKEGSRQLLESVFPLRDSAQRTTHFIHFLQDLSAQQLAETLTSLAFHDSLTGLPNRNLFADRLSMAMAVAQRLHGSFALLYIDIDHFKRVNDTLGHAAGDELLRQVAARLRHCLRGIDTVARLGGDEFAVILDRISHSGLATTMVDKLITACSGVYDLAGGSPRITLSIGAALYPRDAGDTDSLLKRADAAMYRAKAAGRDGCFFAEQRAAPRYSAV